MAGPAQALLRGSWHHRAFSKRRAAATPVLTRQQPRSDAAARSLHAAAGISNGRRQLNGGRQLCRRSGGGGGISASAAPAGSFELANNCVPVPNLTIPSTASAPVGAEDAHAASADDNHSASEEQFTQQIVSEHEIENINQAVHAAFEQEMVTVNQTVQEAVETALLDRSFDIKANMNTMVALTGVIMYWRGIWNLFDSFLGTDNLTANVGSVFIGLAIILLYRILKLPLAEFW
ncbi:hypothetical protein D9Q98_008311 [Chlorella vulgaris]|uniref:Uncharacterized protein n=1 Tax=Chlorella vulgaris TaxID=3077 RepID=A0A9D4YT64_CHLVU|nr:hypothetical protein D9Q98_008311 [Chlorella vulgaris]